MKFEISNESKVLNAYYNEINITEQASEMIRINTLRFKIMFNKIFKKQEEQNEIYN